MNKAISILYLGLCAWKVSINCLVHLADVLLSVWGNLAHTTLTERSALSSVASRNLVTHVPPDICGFIGNLWRRVTLHNASSSPRHPCTHVFLPCNYSWGSHHTPSFLWLCPLAQGFSSSVCLSWRGALFSSLKPCHEASFYPGLPKHFLNQGFGSSYMENPSHTRQHWKVPFI
jgi:hypothetical protein